MPQWKRFSGNWTLTQQLQAVAAETWPGVITGYKLYAFGQGSSGELGNNVGGASQDVSSPVQIGATEQWSNLSASNSSYGVKSGKLFSWGANNSGALAQNDLVKRSSPVQVGALTNWSTVDAGWRDFCMAIKTDGTLWGWGDNDNTQGAIGDNTKINRSSPVQIGSLTDWSKVAAGANFCLAVKTDGTLWSWGHNEHGMLGQNNLVYLSSPVQVGSSTDWATPIAGGTSFDKHGGCIKTDGTLWMWGRNTHGQLGLGDRVDRSSPVQVGAETNWATGSLGDGTSFAITTTNKIYAWGLNNLGQLGLSDTVRRSSPVQIGSLTTWSTVSTKDDHTLTTTTAETVFGWGTGGNGELNNDEAVNKNSPVQIGSAYTNLETAVAGNDHSFVLSTQKVTQ